MRQSFHRFHRFVLLLLTTVLALPLGPVAADPPTGDPVLGTNLAFLRANSGEYPFVNAFKASTPWVSILAGVFGDGTLHEVDGEILSLDPQQEAITFLFQDNPGRYPAGDYIVLYDGDGDLEYEGSGRRHDNRSIPGRDVVHVDPRQGELVIVLTRTNAALPLNNIRVLVPGGVCSNDPYQACKGVGDPVCGTGTCDLFETNYATQIFHPTFLNNIRRFGVLRFMDWMETIEGGFVDFSQYTEENDPRWNPAPMEIMAELGNRIGADIWVNVPHNANNAFITQMATRLEGRLDPTRKVWVEFSNEVWNPNYPSFMDVTLAGCAANPGLVCEAGSDPNDGILCDGHRAGAWFPNCEAARIRETSERTVNAWHLFDAAFGSSTRLVRVMSSQSGEGDLHDGLLQWQSAHQETDVLATAAYFGVPLGGNLAVPGWDLDTLFSALDTEIQDTINLMKSDFYFLEANYPAIPVVHYEGGQHLQAFGPIEMDPALANDLWEMNSLFEDANQDPRIGALYDQLFNAWSQIESPLLCHFTNVHTRQSWSRFGALEYQDQPHGDSVKYQALMRELDNLGAP
jgi:hypothetical protein